MSDFINDGDVVGFSRVIIINSVPYATDDFKFDDPTGVSFTRTSEKSIPTGKVDVRGIISGTATLQLASSATPIPARYKTFTEVEGVFKILKVGKTQTKSGETKVPISFELAITGSLVVT